MSTPPIIRLDRIVADQIAAGEVVERPASIVKELVENSLDAGATRIQLEVDGGGASRLRVVDDGHGIAPDELRLAFERHATSKLTTLADLDGLTSYGFRGEALPSIASVAHVTVESRVADALSGVRLTLEGGVERERREVGCPVGTSFEVRNLFFNVPARLKFLKAEATEASHAAEALLRLALLRPEVTFVLRTNARVARHLPRVERVDERVRELFGGESLARAEGVERGVGVLAVLGAPDRARAGAGSLFTYVNGRFVRDRALLKAVTQAFGGTLPAGRYPVGLIALTVPPAGVDVNVHPQKIEVRFADSHAVYAAVTRVVGEMASRAVWSLAPRPVVAQAASLRETSAPVPVTPPAGEPAPPGRLVPPPAPGLGVAARPAQASLPDLRPLPPADPAPVTVPLVEGTDLAALRYVGQAQNLYLVFEDDEALVLIDQHAAHERVTFERLRAARRDGTLRSQRLIIPEHLDLTPADVERVLARRDELARLGLELDRSGPDRIAIHGLPAEVAGASPARLLADLLVNLDEGRRDSRGALEERLLATLACHGSLRGGRPVAPAEARDLVARMRGIDFAGWCPHGRPVLVRLPWREIGRRVGRG